MSPAQVLLIDDPLTHTEALGCLIDLRPTHGVRTGAMTTRDRWGAAPDVKLIGAFSREELRPLCPEFMEVPDDSAPVVLVCGRCVAPIEDVVRLHEGDELRCAETDERIALCVPHGVVRDRATALSAWADDAGLPPARVRKAPGVVMLRRPWDVRVARDALIAHDLEVLLVGPREGKIDPRAMVVGDDPDAPDHVRVRVCAGASVGAGAILDVTHGPIVVDERGVVRPGATLIGPCYVGKDAVVLDRAIIKSNTAIGPVCKVGGEVGGTIFQGFANKAHDGHLGDSWIGEWANLGAGTMNSNLLNTYGEVSCSATPGAERERTGETFLGAMIGDHVKTAIGTRIMTGAVVLTGTMWASGAPISGTTGRFAWVTDDGWKHYRVDKFLSVARAVMARRGLEMGEAYIARLRELAGEA